MYTFFVSREWFHVSEEEDIWVKSLPGRMDFTWESTSCMFLEEL